MHAYMVLDDACAAFGQASLREAIAQFQWQAYRATEELEFHM